MLSSRLRAKSLISVHGQSMLKRVLDRVKAMQVVDEILIATTKEPADDPIEAFANYNKVLVFRGDQNDVLGRFYESSVDLSDDDIIFRITADNPFYDPDRASHLLKRHLETKADYTHIEGLSHVVPEIFSYGALKKINNLATADFDREHVTPYFRKNPQLFNVQTFPTNFEKLRPELDKYLTIDTYEQVEFIEKMLNDIEINYAFVSVDSCYAWLDNFLSEKGNYEKKGKNELKVNLIGHEIGDGCPTFIVGEVGQNHNGSLEMAKNLIDMAARCGIDAVKFQKRDIKWDLTQEAYNQPYDNPNSFGNTYGKHREFLELSEEQHKELKEYTNARGLIYFCTATDIPSIKVMERVGNPIYKVASRDLANIPLLKEIARTKKPVILSTGMSDLVDIREAINVFAEYDSPIILMQCISQYPADLDKVNLAAIKTLRKEFKRLIGYSDHSVGIIAPISASILGACIVEKHITLSRALKGTDHAGAIEEEGLRRIVKYIREAEIAQGSGLKQFEEVVQNAKKKLSRSLCSKIFIKKGSMLTEEMLVLKSPGEGISWKDRSLIIGKTASKDILENTTLKMEDFEK